MMITTQDRQADTTPSIIYLNMRTKLHTVESDIYNKREGVIGAKVKAMVTSKQPHLSFLKREKAARMSS